MISKQIKPLFFSLIIACSVVLTSSSCKKNSHNSQIPNVNVDLIIPLSLPQYAPLNSIGNHYVVENAGVRGIVIYRKSLEEFSAFDLACPYDYNSNSSNRLQVDSGGTGTVDYTCGSRFLLFDGAVINGPATVSMKPYAADFNTGNQQVHIYNY